MPGDRDQRCRDRQNRHDSSALNITLRVVLPEFLFDEIVELQPVEPQLALFLKRRIQIVTGRFDHRMFRVGLPKAT